MAVTGINNLDLSCFVFTDPSIDGSFTYSAFVHRLYVSQCQLSSDFVLCSIPDMCRSGIVCDDMLKLGTCLQIGESSVSSFIGD